MGDESQRLARLVVRLQNGDMAAFDEIYQLTYERAVFTSLKICRSKEDANDIVQESYMYLLDKANDIRNPEAFMSWFNMVVASKTKNMLRKNNPVLFGSRETEEYVLDSIEEADTTFQPSDDVEQTELCEEVMELIDNLSDDKRTAVILFYYDEMTTKQIAESLGVNENTIKSRLVQAKKDLTKGIKALEKENKCLYGIAPVPLIIWALKGSAKTTGKSFAVSGGAAATLTAVKTATAGAAVASGATAAAGTTATATAGGIAAKIAGFSVVQKVISGVVVAGIVAGGAVGTKAVINHQKQDNDESATKVAQIVELTENSSNECQITKRTFERRSMTTDNNVSLATTLTKTVAMITTEATTKTVSYDITKATTKVKTTAAKTTTTVVNAIINIVVTQSGEKVNTKVVTVSDGDVFTFSEAKEYVRAMGYNTSTAMYEGNLPITAEAGKVYSIIIDVE